jgi:hypothetical protein
MRKLSTIAVILSVLTLFSCQKLTSPPTNPTNTTQPPTDSIFEGQMGVFNLGTGNTFATTTDTAAWHYIAVTKAANLAGQIYLDGQLVADTVFQNKVYNYSTIYLAASNYTSFTGFYNGYLDEFRVSNTVRTAQEIQAYYASNAPFTSDSNTIGLWHFDETNGSTTFANAVGSNGTLTNNPQFVSGKFGNAVYFNGTNQYGNCNLSIPSSNITLEFWYKTSVPQATTLVQPYGTNSTNIYYTTKKVAQQNAPTTLSNGLVAYYPFNGNANDSSGNKNNGTVYNATLTTDRFGNANNAYSFNGVNSYISVPNSATLQFANSEQSISLWIYLNNIPNLINNDMSIISKTNQNLSIDPTGNSDMGFEVSIGGTGNQLFDRFKNAGDTTSWGKLYLDSASLSLNSWNNFVFTVDKQNSIMYAFLNGTKIDSSIIPPAAEIGLNNLPLLIGNGYWMNGVVPTYHFLGLLDDIRIYNRVLNQQEITYLATH